MTKMEVAITCLNNEDYTFETAEQYGKWDSKSIRAHAVWALGKGLIEASPEAYEAVRGGSVASTIELANDAVPARKNKPHFDVNKRFYFMDQLVGMVAKGSQTSLFIAGPGGLGKTHTVLNSLNANGAEYKFVKGYSTPRGLFNTLRDNRDSVIVFDDCDSVFKDGVGSNILKAATDSYSERIVSWNKSEGRSEEETEFEFTGRIIFISNLSIRQFPQALQSRSTLVDLEMTTEEKIVRMETVLDNIDVQGRECEEEKIAALELIRQNSDRISDINFRTLIKITSIFLDGGINEESKELALFVSCN